MYQVTRWAALTNTSVNAACAAGRLAMYGCTPPHHARFTVIALVSIVPSLERNGPNPLLHASHPKRGGSGVVVVDDNCNAIPLPRYGNHTLAGDGPPGRNVNNARPCPSCTDSNAH